jgi:hypothetical protein
MEAITGGCACGTVRYEVTAPFESASYCHCHRCQRRTGTAWSINARIAPEHFRITAGEEAVRTWAPENGFPKSFCSLCGSALFSGGGELPVGVRMGTLDGDPGVRPSYRQWLESAPAWETVPDDGLDRYPRARG